MKKYITFMLLMLLLPGFVLAKDNYESKNLEDTLKDEGIEYDLGDYEANDNKVTVYLFRGKGCSHCHEFLEYVSTDLLKNSGEYFKLESYEVWNNKDNSKLMQQVSNYLGDDASGVPYIIIGDKTFSGYAESMNEEIESAIKKLYDSEDKYDVFREMKINPKSSKKSAKKKDNSSVIVTILLSGIAIVALLVTSLRKKVN